MFGNNREEIKAVRNKGKLMAAACFMAIYLTGCETELADVANKDTMVSSSQIEDEDSCSINQVLGEFHGDTLIVEADVPEEDFKLKTIFSTDDYSVENWRITDVKTLDLCAYTEGLPEGTEVYIDNVHIDSVIKSIYAAFDAIPIDSMDDRTHSTMYPGFPVSDKLQYHGVFAIGGYSDTLISGYSHGYKLNNFGISNGYIEESRVTEKTLQNSAVYANMFQIIWDLWIQKPGEIYPYMTSVKTEFLIPTKFIVDNISLRYNGKNFDGINEKGEKEIYSYSNGEFSTVSSGKERIPDGK